MIYFLRSNNTREAPAVAVMKSREFSQPDVISGVDLLSLLTDL